MVPYRASRWLSLPVFFLVRFSAATLLRAASATEAGACLLVLDASGKRSQGEVLGPRRWIGLCFILFVSFVRSCCLLVVFFLFFSSLLLLLLARYGFIVYALQPLHLLTFFFFIFLYLLSSFLSFTNDTPVSRLPFILPSSFYNSPEDLPSPSLPPHSLN